MLKRETKKIALLKTVTGVRQTHLKQLFCTNFFARWIVGGTVHTRADGTAERSFPAILSRSRGGLEQACSWTGYSLLKQLRVSINLEQSKQKLASKFFFRCDIPLRCCVETAWRTAAFLHTHTEKKLQKAGYWVSDLRFQTSDFRTDRKTSIHRSESTILILPFYKLLNARGVFCLLLLFVICCSTPKLWLKLIQTKKFKKYKIPKSGEFNIKPHTGSNSRRKAARKKFTTSLPVLKSKFEWNLLVLFGR